jgi:cell division GTPase FtsZ
MTKEEIRQAAQDWDGSGMATPAEEGAFIKGAEWMQEKMIEKAAKWLRKNIDEDVFIPCGNVIKIISADEFVEYFTNSMEEEK